MLNLCHVALLFLLLTCSSCWSPKGWNEGQRDYLTVTTSNGPITGHIAPNRSNVVEYLGIPYARPPTGSLRFAPPLPYTTKQAHNASDWGYDCPNPASRPYRDFPGQTTQAPIILGPATLNESEDCLTLNIWTPRTKPNHGPSLYQKRKWKPNHPILKPVLVYIYGGQFTTGRTHSKLINGRYLSAAQDVVVVTVNYRINIFGFSGSPGYPQNAGLRDQRLAVEWIHANIAQFGGDPEKIVLFGQSAGAVGVDYLSYAYAQEPIVKGFILESGNSFSFPVHNQSTAVKNWYNVSTELGCGGSGDTIDCMRQQDWEDIKVAAAKVKSGDSGTVLRPIPAFYPTPDEEIVFSDYLGLLASGKYAKLPHLIGNNNNEPATYALTAFRQPVNESTFPIAEKFLLSAFSCPSLFQSSQLSSTGLPTWLYRYVADWENIRLYDGSGAFHTSELYMVFGTSEDVTGDPATEAEKEMSAIFQKAWAAFADDPVEGLEKVMGWPVFSPDDETLIRLGNENQAMAEFVSPSLYGSPCSTIVLGSLATPHSSP